MRSTIITLIAIFSVMALIGYMNYCDIENCKARGSSEQICSHVFNR